MDNGKALCDWPEDQLSLTGVQIVAARVTFVTTRVRFCCSIVPFFAKCSKSIPLFPILYPLLPIPEGRLEISASSPPSRPKWQEMLFSSSKQKWRGQAALTRCQVGLMIGIRSGKRVTCKLRYFALIAASSAGSVV
eukprot:IDg7711t1